MHLPQTLNGAFIYMADLVRAIRPLPDGMQLDFLRASSYVGASTTSEEAVSLGLVSKISVTGRHVLVVEDIIDTGATLQVSQSAAAPHGLKPGSALCMLHALGWMSSGLLFACSGGVCEVASARRGECAYCSSAGQVSTAHSPIAA